MTEQIRIGILGHGFIGSVHREVLVQLPSFHVVCVADPLDDHVQSVDVQRYTDYRSLLDQEHKNIDAVIVALPTGLHLPAVDAAADYGLAILLEKPMGRDAEESRRIKTKIAEADGKLMVGMTGRYHPEFVRAYEALTRIGGVLSLDERMHFGGTPFRMHYLDKENYGRGVGLTNGVHTIDRFLWYAGEEIASVTVDHQGNELLHADLEDNIRGNVHFARGNCGRFSLRWSPNREEDYVFEVVGQEGIIRVYGYDRAIIISDNTEQELYRHTLSDVRERHKPGIQAELEAFAVFLRGSEKTKYVDDCLQAQQVIDKFYIHRQK